MLISSRAFVFISHLSSKQYPAKSKLMKWKRKKRKGKWWPQLQPHPLWWPKLHLHSFRDIPKGWMGILTDWRWKGHSYIKENTLLYPFIRYKPSTPTKIFFAFWLIPPCSGWRWVELCWEFAEVTKLLKNIEVNVGRMYLVLQPFLIKWGAISIVTTTQKNTVQPSTDPVCPSRMVHTLPESSGEVLCGKISVYKCAGPLTSARKERHIQQTLNNRPVVSLSGLLIKHKLCSQKTPDQKGNQNTEWNGTTQSGTSG